MVRSKRRHVKNGGGAQGARKFDPDDPPRPGRGAHASVPTGGDHYSPSRSSNRGFDRRQERDGDERHRNGHHDDSSSHGGHRDDRSHGGERRQPEPRSFIHQLDDRHQLDRRRQRDSRQQEDTGIYSDTVDSEGKRQRREGDRSDERRKAHASSTDFSGSALRKLHIPSSVAKSPTQSIISGPARPTPRRGNLNQSSAPTDNSGTLPPEVLHTPGVRDRSDRTSPQGSTDHARGPTAAQRAAQQAAQEKRDAAKVRHSKIFADTNWTVHPGSIIRVLVINWDRKQTEDAADSYMLVSKSLAKELQALMPRANVKTRFFIVTCVSHHRIFAVPIMTYGDSGLDNKHVSEHDVHVSIKDHRVYPPAKSFRQHGPHLPLATENMRGTYLKATSVVRIDEPVTFLRDAQFETCGDVQAEDQNRLVRLRRQFQDVEKEVFVMRPQFQDAEREVIENRLETPSEGCAATDNILATTHTESSSPAGMAGASPASDKASSDIEQASLPSAPRISALTVPGIPELTDNQLDQWADSMPDELKRHSIRFALRCFFSATGTEHEKAANDAATQTSR